MSQALPEFDATGLLPDGIHPCDAAQFQERFVASFTGSVTREPICDGFTRWRTAVAAFSLSARQWVDGSYVLQAS